MAKLPFMQFYPTAWLSDPNLRSVSSGARGLWMDMLCLMWQSPRRGYLELNGKIVTSDLLARMTGNSPGDTSHHLQELENAGVYSLSEHGIIYSRRIVNDEHKRQKCSDAGKKGGGNPAFSRGSKTFKGQPKGGDKGDPKPPPNIKKLEVRSYKEPLEPNGSSPPVRAEEFANSWNRLCGSLAKVREFSDSRRAKVKARINQGVSLQTFEEAAGLCLTTPFLSGANDRGWTATFDWLIENDRNIAKVLEGVYSRVQQPQGVTGNGKSNGRLSTLEQLDALEAGAK